MERLFKPLNYRFRFAGIIFLILGLATLIVYLTLDAVISIPAVAVVSSYIETDFFKIVSTNIVDELIFIFMIVGFTLIVFSRGKNEKIDQITKAKALFSALKINSILLIISVLFLYGQAFMWALVLNVFTINLIYILIIIHSENRKRDE